MNTIACVGAHALDAEVMGGGAAARLAQKGWSALMIHMTRGERSQAENKRQEYGKQLEREMEQAAAHLGASAIWMGYAGGDIPEDAALKLALLFREKRVDVVVTHHSGSYHPRHVLTHHAVRRAIQLAADPAFAPDFGIHRVKGLYYGENLEDLEGFAPSVYVDVSAAYERWMQALACYELFRGGIAKYPYNSYYPSAAVTRGLEANVPYAQAFMVPRFLSEDLDASMELCKPAY